MRGLYLSLALLLLVTGCAPEPTQPDRIVVYTGRSEALVAELLERFTAETGIQVDVRYGETAQLALALQEEGEQTRADVFWSQDVGALAALSASGLLAAVPDSLQSRVPEQYRGADWLATSIRARTLVYATNREIAPVPTSITELAQAAYNGRVGWAPTNASFQAMVTAMRRKLGDEGTLAWLVALKDGGARTYARNSAIVQAVADGEIDFGLTNHYYLLRMRAENAAIPVAQTVFAANDPGNLVNSAGVAVLRPRENAAAWRFVAFLLSETSQAYFVDETAEYSVLGGREPAGVDLPLAQIDATATDVSPEALADLNATLALLRQAGLL